MPNSKSQETSPKEPTQSSVKLPSSSSSIDIALRNSLLEAISSGSQSLGNMAVGHAEALSHSSNYSQAASSLIAAPPIVAATFAGHYLSEQDQQSSNPGQRALARTGRDLALAHVPVAGSLVAAGNIAGIVALGTDPLASRLTKFREEKVDFSRPLTEIDEGILDAEALAKLPGVFSRGINRALDTAAEGIHAAGDRAQRTPSVSGIGSSMKTLGRLLHSDVRAFDQSSSKSASIIQIKPYEGEPAPFPLVTKPTEPPVRMPILPAKSAVESKKRAAENENNGIFDQTHKHARREQLFYSTPLSVLSPPSVPARQDNTASLALAAAGAGGISLMASSGRTPKNIE